MSRRRDAATITVGAGLTAGGGYLRHTGVQQVIAADRAAGRVKDPRAHGWAIARRGSKGARKLYGAGALVGLIGAPALGIGATKFVRGEPVAKRDPNKPSFLQEGLAGTGEALLERKETLQQKVPAKARIAGYATTTGAGALGVVGARLAMRGKGGGLKALASPVAGVLAGAAATPVSSKVVHHVAPGYEVTASGVRRKKKPLKRPSSASYRHVGTPRSFQADVSKIAVRVGYHGTSEKAARKVLANGFQPRNVGGPHRHAPDVRGDGVYLANESIARRYAQRMKGSPASTKIPNRRALLKVGTVGPVHDGSVTRLGMRGYRGVKVNPDQVVMVERVAKLDRNQVYRAKVSAAGSIPVAGYVMQPVAAGHGIKSPSHRYRAEATQSAAQLSGDAIGVTAGAHAAAYGAKRSMTFRRHAESLNGQIDNAKSKVGLKPKPLKPAGAGGGRAGQVVRAATKPLRGPYAAAAGAGALVGSMTIGNGLQQAAISHNIKHHVGKSDTGMTRREQQKQLKRRSRLVAINVMGATTGAAGLGTFLASRHPHFTAHKPALTSATVGLSAIGGGIGSYGGFKRAKVEHKDIKAQRKALGIAKGWKQAPDFSGYVIGEPNKKLLQSTALKRDAKYKMNRHGVPLTAQPAHRIYGPIEVGKGMPDQADVHVPSGLLKTKTYAASTVRRTPTGKLVRIAAGVR